MLLLRFLLSRSDVACMLLAFSTGPCSIGALWASDGVDRILAWVTRSSLVEDTPGKVEDWLVLVGDKSVFIAV